ncbi:MAG: hypothetical protein LQ351_006535 [Letrouitia transgressa]|nr:MAG: hypothetical protein LQ351_006535 [Letrouitia transgressa]
MATQNVPLPQGRDIQRRVAENISDETGNLEDQSLDLDARAMAILGKRQQLSRNFGLVSLVAFSTTLIASWESIASLFVASQHGWFRFHGFREYERMEQ